MIKRIAVLFLTVFSFSVSADEIYRERMKELIREIRNNTTKERIIITQNGSEVYFKDRNPDRDFFALVDGASQESLIYGENGKLSSKTSASEKKSLLENLLVVKDGGKTVFSVNYAKGKSAQKVIDKESRRYGFVGEAVPGFEADVLNVPIRGFNRKNIYSLKDADNFLYLLNPHKFKNIDEYFRILAKSNYDVLIIEPSVKGKFFSREQVEKLKYKATGERRIVIAYFSIGEAEDYRSYWKDEWSKKLPQWIEAENKNWKGNYIVQYWSPQWREIVQNYQKNLDAIGVDGYYLDTIDSFYYFEP